MGAIARLKLLKSAAMENITSTDFNDTLGACLVAASAIAASFCNRIFEADTYEDEPYTGNDTTRLFLRNTPVISVDSVNLWDGSDSYDEEDSDYYSLIDGTYLQYPALGKNSLATWSGWEDIYENGIQVTYTAGYVVTNWQTAEVTDDFNVPPDLEMAVARMAQQLWKDGKKGGARFGLTQMSKGVESIAVDRFIKGMPEDVTRILHVHRRLTI